MRGTHMRAKHGLQPHSLDQLVDWSFANRAYSTPYDQVSSRAEWHEMLDAVTMFRQLISGLVRAKSL